MGNQYLEQFTKSLEDWTDERFISRQQLSDLAMFIMYLVNLADEEGWVYTGHSLTIGLPWSRLVVRGVVGGVPSVVFCSGQTTAACIRIFMRKMEGGLLEWSKDRFRS